MSSSSAQSRRARAAAEATEWSLRLDIGFMSVSERNEFMTWLRESPLHVSEMLETARLTSELSRFEGWKRVAPSGNVSIDEVTRLPSRPAGGIPRRRWRISRNKWSIAAIAAVLCCVTISVMMLEQRLPATNIRTQPGERRVITLPDGSIVQLSPDTELRIRLMPQLRTITIGRGEAAFRVAKDAARPFIVDATSARVRAVGTVFSVVRSAEAVTVTVTEGRVSVTPALQTRSDPEAVAFPLAANERVIVSVKGIASPVRHLESVPMLDWGDNRLAFEDTRVADVVGQFNRRNTLQIRLTDTALASRTISGIFDANDPQSLVDFLESVASAASKRDGNEIIVTHSNGVTHGGNAM